MKGKNHEVAKDTKVAKEDNVSAFTPPTLPMGTFPFAEAVAELADKHGITRFVMTFRPSLDDELNMCMNRDASCSGEIKVDYSSRDGRHRPRRKLNVTLDAHLVHRLVDEPDSV